MSIWSTRWSRKVWRTDLNPEERNAEIHISTSQNDHLRLGVSEGPSHWVGPPVANGAAWEFEADVMLDREQARELATMLLIWADGGSLPDHDWEE